MDDVLTKKRGIKRGVGNRRRRGKKKRRNKMALNKERGVFEFLGIYFRKQSRFIGSLLG